MPVFMIIGDGMADLPVPELGGRTPLEIADCGNMTRLCSRGRSGLLEPLGPGVVGESEEAIMAILGYSHLRTRLTRGPLEALGTDLSLDENDLAFRCNFASVSKDLVVADDRVDNATLDSSKFTESLNDFCCDFWGAEAQFRATWKFKAVLVLKGDGLSTDVSTPPPQKGMVASRTHPTKDTPEAKRTSTMLNSIIAESNKILSKTLTKENLGQETGVLVPWGIGKRFSADSFESKYGVNGACIGGAALIRGIGRLCGMTVVPVPGATGGPDTDTLAKARASLKACKEHDFILVHVGGPDEASHDGDIASKILIIKKMDSMLGHILDNVDLNETVVTLLADHTSSTVLRRHTHHPTPIAIAGGRTQSGRVKEYSERATANGELGRTAGEGLMQLVLDQAHCR